MNSMGIQNVLAIFLFISTVTAEQVTFSGIEFTMTCPFQGDWTKNGRILVNATNHYTHNYTNDDQGLYKCKNDTESYHFYVKGKVCEKCIELDAGLIGLVIVVDGIGTAFLILLIYKCTKKKSSTGPTHSSKANAAPANPVSAPARSGGRAPPVPSPDYEQLNPHTRAQDPYSMVNRTG